MDIMITLTGRSPLLMHSDAGVDPEHPLNKAMKQITAKTSSKRTEEDHRLLDRLEWEIGLYLDDAGQVTVPAANVRKSIIRGGVLTKQGTQVARGLVLSERWTEFEHDGPSDLRELYARPEFSDRRSVGVGQKRVMRVRPHFASWGLRMRALLVTDVLDLDDLRQIASTAGVVEGVGDNRINGFGRYAAVVEEA